MQRIISIFAFIGMFFTTVSASQMVKIQSQQIQHWNHPATSSEQYLGLKHHADAYALKIEKTAEAEQVQITLIKKVANWHQQHSNGLKIDFSQSQLTFDQIKALSLQLSLNKRASSIPTVEQLKTVYREYIDSGLIDVDWLEEMVSQLGVINIKLFGEHHGDQNIATVLANYQLVLYEAMDSSAKTTQEEAIDIVLSDFDLYRQKNWQEQQVSIDDITSIKVIGMLITAETNNEKTLRSYLQERYVEELPEHFIELAISLADLTLTLADENL
mgnify:CR=1 FL=1